MFWRRNAKAGAGAALIMGRRKIDGRQKRPRLWEPRIELMDPCIYKTRVQFFFFVFVINIVGLRTPLTITFNNKIP